MDKRLTGSLELFAPDKRNAVVLLAGGEPAKVRTSEPVAHLGQVLQELGYLDEQVLSRSLAELAKRKAVGPALHGALLLENAAIDLPTLRKGLAEQVGRKLHHVAAMPGDTAFAYYEGLDVLKAWGGDDSAPIDAVPHLWSMLREYPPWDHVNAALARVAGSDLRLAVGADLSRLRLGQEEGAAAELMRRRTMRVSELANAASINERTAQLLVHLLLITRQLDVFAGTGPATAPARISLPSPPAVSRPPPGPSRASAAPSGPGPRERSSKPTAIPSGPTRSVPPAPPAGLAPALTERWKEITDRAATIDRADYFMMLELARDATAED
ncbi:MAG: hypothetical protein ACRELB_27580, partial [Polyangiaceae bacterium]